MATDDPNNPSPPVDPFTGQNSVEERFKTPIDVFKSEPISLDKDMGGFMNEIMQMKGAYGGETPANKEETTVVTSTEVTQTQPSALKPNNPPTPRPSEPSSGGAALNFELKTICHLGAPAQQGFAINGPPVPL